MITIDLGNIEYYDGLENKFIYKEGGIVRFEYSLRVLYEWEGRWRKPFLAGNLSYQELRDFYILMALDPFDPEFLTEDVMKKLANYISDSNTATTFNEPQGGGSSSTNSRGKIYTAEELYARMSHANIPLEFENRNLNRLLIVLRIIASYNEEPKKMSRDDIYKQNRSLNAARKAQMKTRG